MAHKDSAKVLPRRDTENRDPARDSSAPRRNGLSAPVFGILAIALGAGAGLGAYAFRLLIALVHNLAFLGTWSFKYDANLHTPASPWGLFVVVVPVLGALAVVFLVKNFAPEAKGHGVPEIMDAIYYQRGKIRPVVAAIKSLASAISIGTGGSVGREGPIAQIGSTLGSLSGTVTNLAHWQRATLVAGGGAAGIAATFNTPIGGILFAVEVLMHEVSARTLVPVALSTTMATYVARSFLGDQPAFPVPEIAASERVSSLPAFVILGCLTALASVAFIRTLYASEDLFERRIPNHPYLRHALGMLATGVVFTGLYASCGHYYVQGVGYATVSDILDGRLAASLVVSLFVLKLLVTVLTLGSGASGGIFSPSLFLGATAGAAFGMAATGVLHEEPGVFALAGMAGMVGGTTGAVLTAIVMLFEMTRDYSMVLPMALTASVSYGVRRLLLNDSIYTLKLTRRGRVTPQALQANAHLYQHVSDLRLTAVPVLPATETLAALNLSQTSDEPPVAVLVDDGRVSAVVSLDWVRRHTGEVDGAQSLRSLPRTAHRVIRPDTTLFDVLARLRHQRAAVGVVVAVRDDGSHEVLGVISKADLAQALAEGMQLFTD